MYCTIEDLQKQARPEVLLLVARLDDGSGLDTDAIEKAIADASAEIDSYAASQYKVPFQTVPGIINKFTVDIALYNLYSRHGFKEDSEDAVILLRYQAAVKFLENLAKGTVKIAASELGEAGGSGTDMSSLTAATIINPPRLFSREKMKGY